MWKAYTRRERLSIPHCPACSATNARAPVGEKKACVERALAAVTPFLTREPAPAA